MSIVSCKEFKVNSIPQKEIFRYMRAREITDELSRVVSEAEKLVLLAAGCRACWARTDVKTLSENSLTIGNMEMVSADLSRRLCGCDEAYVFAVTTGVGVDRAIRTGQVKSHLLAFACDAAGSALVEEICDLLNSHLADLADMQGKKTVKRFSVGYGDLSLEYQKQICGFLDTPKNIGASLTDGVMMTPSKTVTAIIGIK